MIDILDLDSLMLNTGKWADETFPNSSPATIISHLKEEMKELAYAVDAMIDEDIAEESADMILLICHLAYKRGISLNRVVQWKLNKNKQREWNTEAEPGGHFKHKKDGE